MLTGCTFFRMPSRVPLSTFSPQQDPLEREEERPLAADPLEQQSAIRVEEPLVQRWRKVPRILRQESSLDPLHHVFRSRQDMRIDDQAHGWNREPQSEHQTRV